MIKFTTTILKFAAQGEKTGWTYILIPAEKALEIKPNNKKSFRVKGKLDGYAISQVAMIPMGEGDFIIALNAAMRKGFGKTKGAELIVQLEEDKTEYQMNEAFMDCLNDEPAALAWFQSFSASHQRYFSKWIDAAKTEQTITKRIALAVSSLAKKMDYGQMIRSQKDKHNF